MRLPLAFAIGVLLLTASSCGDCAGVAFFRLSETERTIAVGQSFSVIVEEGGSCTNISRPSGGQVRWSSSDTSIVRVDSASGLVTGKRIGDATVVPNTHTEPLSLLVHVR